MSEFPQNSDIVRVRIGALAFDGEAAIEEAPDDGSDDAHDVAIAWWPTADSRLVRRGDLVEARGECFVVARVARSEAVPGALVAWCVRVARATAAP